MVKRGDFPQLLGCPYRPTSNRQEVQKFARGSSKCGRLVVLFLWGKRAGVGHARPSPCLDQGAINRIPGQLDAGREEPPHTRFTALATGATGRTNGVAGLVRSRRAIKTYRWVFVGCRSDSFLVEVITAASVQEVGEARRSLIVVFLHPVANAPQQALIGYFRIRTLRRNNAISFQVPSSIYAGKQQLSASCSSPALAVVSAHRSTNRLAGKHYPEWVDKDAASFSWSERVPRGPALFLPSRARRSSSHATHVHGRACAPAHSQSPSKPKAAKHQMRGSGAERAPRCQLGERARRKWKCRE
ncbi:hypothetical protein CALCODRAFT_184910 [Calocera cornea HHB12733]|uniref:Uncharacterized protein n=1 Tax=Calocera cornea HHB12733 TaxID=1353952 RepID=A0A165CA04_9BASI|nr:hypothetical protein CALCODRAFT_184910 [Calocera cornea HHB12733]